MESLPEPLVVDNSILSAVAKCETYAYVRYACGLNTRTESLALSAGSAVHAGLAAWLSGVPAGKAVQLMATTYEEDVSRYLRKLELDDLGEKDARFKPAWVEAIFAQYLEAHAEGWTLKVIKATMEKPISHPFPVEVPSGRKVRYVARLDAIVRRWEEGQKWLCDHKTTRKVSDWWKDKMKVSSQFSGQLWLADQGAVENEVAGVVLNVIELPEPHKSERKCPEHKVSYQECSVRHAGWTFVWVPRHRQEIWSWFDSASLLTRKYDRLQRRAMEEGVEGVKAVPMQGRFNDSCTFCSMKEWCYLGRNVRPSAIRATFIEESWDPERVEE